MIIRIVLSLLLWIIDAKRPQKIMDICEYRIVGAGHHQAGRILLTKCFNWFQSSLRDVNEIQFFTSNEQSIAYTTAEHIQNILLKVFTLITLTSLFLAVKAYKLWWHAVRFGELRVQHVVNYKRWKQWIWYQAEVCRIACQLWFTFIELESTSSWYSRSCVTVFAWTHLNEESKIAKNVVEGQNFKSEFQKLTPLHVTCVINNCLQSRED